MSDKSELKAELERKKQRIAQIREEKKRKEEEKKKKDVRRPMEDLKPPIVALCHVIVVTSHWYIWLIVSCFFNRDQRESQANIITTS